MGGGGGSGGIYNNIFLVRQLKYHHFQPGAADRPVAETCYIRFRKQLFLINRKLRATYPFFFLSLITWFVRKEEQLVSV